MTNLVDDLGSAVRSTAADWKKAKRRADKEDRVSRHDLNRLTYRPARVTIREAAFHVMESAYEKASSSGRYYANARQIMYAARPLVLEATGGEIWRDSSYFTQTLLKDYLERYNPAWKVVWDARGHLTEPHMETVVPLGGLGVLEYTRSWTDDKFEVFEQQSPKEKIDTKGPSLRYRNVLFIEKEGFDPILKDAGFAESHDMAIMSTKGVPVGAACDLVSKLSRAGVQVFVLHDFDLAGFKIVRTLRRGTRLNRGNPNAIDLGIRLEDVHALNLESEAVDYRQERNPKYYLKTCGATEEECAFLVGQGVYGGWSGQRVELNAMTSEELINWLTQKVKDAGVSKLVPDEETLAEAYRRASFLITLEEQTQELARKLEERPTGVPADLLCQVQVAVEDDEALSWDEAVWEIASSGNDE